MDLKDYYYNRFWLVLFILIILVGLWLVSVYFSRDKIVINTNEDSPIELVGGGGERIYLRYGTIYALKDDPKKEYDIVAFTLHVTPERYKQMIFFNTPEEAEAVGYKPSEDFARDYACFQQGKDLLDCLAEE